MFLKFQLFAQKKEEISEKNFQFLYNLIPKYTYT